MIEGVGDDDHGDDDDVDDDDHGDDDDNDDHGDDVDKNGTCTDWTPQQVECFLWRQKYKELEYRMFSLEKKYKELWKWLEYIRLKIILF